jgi:hypothetical protein
MPVRENRRLRVGGLPTATDNHNTDLGIRDVFKDFVVEAVSKVGPVIDQEVDAGRGWYAFVDVESAEERKRAIAQLDGTKRWGGGVAVGLAGGVPGDVLRTVGEEERRKIKEAEETSKDSRMKMSWLWMQSS